MTTPAPKLQLTDDEWRKKLAPDEYAVLRRAGTERPFTGEYTDTTTEGVYECRACGAELFRSDGLTYTFSQSQAAKKTTFIADAGYTMWVCVWHANEQTSTVCSPHFAMNGTPPVAEKVS